MARMSITFDGFADLAEQIDRVGNDLHTAVDEALKETQGIVSTELSAGALPYRNKGLKGYATGKMYSAIQRDNKIEWAGSIATVGTGFSYEQNKAGFIHSIFVMYGTPRMSKDTKVYNAIKGTKVKKEIYEKQQEIMQKYTEFKG